jgi:hypothetical protein
VITPDQKFRKRLKPQNTVYSAEQEAIIKAIYVTQRTGGGRVIITDSVSVLMAVEGDINSKNPNTVNQKTTGKRKRENHPSLGYQEMKSQTKKQKLPWKTTSYPQKNTHHKI